MRTFDYALLKLGLDEQEVEEIMRAPRCPPRIAADSARSRESDDDL
jgi:hypothetical protein